MAPAFLPARIAGAAGIGAYNAECNVIKSFTALNYNFSAPVRLEPHAMRLRPREDYELLIESAKLKNTGI